MSTQTQSRNKPASVQSSPSSRMGDAMAWIAKAPKQPMVLETVDLGPLGAEDVEVAVEHCGLCHSDLSVLNNDWGFSQYPAILGLEGVGVVCTGAVRLHSPQCFMGSTHFGQKGQCALVGIRGGCASHIRAHWAWAIPLPEKLNFAAAGPLLCGGITVFAPLAMYAKPTDRVGIIGIGGLGHITL